MTFSRRQGLAWAALLLVLFGATAPVGAATQASKPTTSAPAGKAAQPPARFVPRPKVPLKDQMDVNHASRAALMKLPGVTGALADKVIAGRPYLAKTKLVTQGVLPNELFQQIRDHVYAGGPLPAGK